MLNSFVCMGRLVADPIIETIPNGKRKARFGLANTLDKSRVSFFNVESWNEAVFPYLKKGQLVTVVGIIEMISYQAKDGTTKKTDRVTANRIDLMDFFLKKEERGEEETTVEAPALTSVNNKKGTETTKQQISPDDFSEEDIPF